MKCLISLALIFLVHAVLPLNGDSIEQTCKQTPFYDLCVSSLKSDPRSSSSDTKGLALIMVDKIKAKTIETLDKINILLKERPELNQPLSSCADYYKAILEADVPEAVEALKLNNPKFAENGMNDAAVEADSCEEAFKSGSPLTQMNKFMHDISVVAAAIVRMLL